jgi:predicted ATP-grasp superfamily ATP-dependent carboligase
VEVSSAEELVQNYAEMEKSGVGIMVQEIIPGGDEQFYGLLTYFGENSEALAIFTKRKLRQTGMGYGDGSFQVSVWVPTVAELGIRLLENMKYRGLAGIEFKKDRRDGQFKLIEINPRSVTGEMMAVKSGVDIPLIAYLDTIGERVEPNSSFTEGMKWVSLEWDFKTFLAYRERKMLNFTDWIKSLRGGKSYAIWSHDDPLPFIILLTRIFRAAVRKIFRSRRMVRFA